MDKILLVISDPNLRQVYHELLFSKTIEIVATDSIGNAIMLLTIHEFRIAVFFVDEETGEIETFLTMRKKHAKWNNTIVILLTTEEARYSPWFLKNDIACNPLTSTLEEIVSTIKSSL